MQALQLNYFLALFEVAVADRAQVLLTTLAVFSAV